MENILGWFELIGQIMILLRFQYHPNQIVKDDFFELISYRADNKGQQNYLITLIFDQSRF